MATHEDKKFALTMIRVPLLIVLGLAVMVVLFLAAHYWMRR
jgi:hypothetical protein